ncbi:Hypothetical protein SRAE_X000047300 [Strongyloides ratti]|uniref:Uncharacterized protein n=1 Tax=Strongyloides ratti TaxID=34506 RepID=A0A090LN33_STRRB|nr:Hypothetical protein SRAE_X000047300 [Strongyloides ratti]CEF71146.1 Hypothetical protein SRAE_X000047300 [Strongyloides ratti]
MITTTKCNKNLESKKKVFKRRHWITGTGKEEFINEIRNAVKPCYMPINLKSKVNKEYKDNFVLEYNAIIQPYLNKPICFSVSLYPKISIVHKITYLGYEDETNMLNNNVAFKHETYRVSNDGIILEQDQIKNITFFSSSIEVNFSNGVNGIFTLLENEKITSEEADLLHESTILFNSNISIKFIPDKNALQKNETNKKAYVIFFKKLS